uniref:Myc box-dependent-interacting protein 1 n=1 Tax=Scophthalmus maximus TaxID=52904 RepID=A0A8D2ZFS2_SCOMX
MAEMGKGVTAGKLASNVQKRLTRAQEKVLQKLGKADETRDAAFEEMVANFNKQMTEGSKLQKDLKAYVTAVKTLHDASRHLQDCLAEMYEPDWFGKEEMDSLAEDTDTLWLDYHQNITDKSVTSMDMYLTQFPDIKARIAKRDRKMVDFDSARHHFASLQKGKKKDEAKIAKAEEELGRAQKIFEELNVELQDELPALWDNRVGVYVNTFQSLAGQQEKFHREMSKVSETAHTCDPSNGRSRRIHHTVGQPGPPPSRPPPRPSPSPDQVRSHAGLFEDEAPVPDTNADSAGTKATEQVRLTDHLHQILVFNKERSLFNRNLYFGLWLYSLQVKAIHDYSATDGDELELTIGDVVLVLAFDNPDEQDDGWLMGMQESQWLQKKEASAKGVFPENFTQKV